VPDEKKPEPSPMPPPLEAVFRPWLWALLAVATAVKLWLLAHTRGTSDSENWFFFARHALRWGLFDAYDSIGPIFNHPPLATVIETGSLMAGRGLGDLVGMAADRYPGRPFLWVRLPALVADVAGAFVLAPLLRARFGARTARFMVAALIASPLTFLVGVWHGNTDLIWSVVVLAAVLVLEWPFARPPRFGRAVRVALAGGIVGLAVSIKLPAIVALAPLGIIAERERRGAWLAVGFLATALPFTAWGLVEGGYPFVTAVFGYQGTVTAVPWPPGRFAAFLGEAPWAWFLTHGHVFVGVAAVLVSLAWSKRGRGGDAVAAVYVAVLLVLPVFGCQYLAWAALPVALLGWRAALLFHLAATLEAWIVYDFPITKFMTEEEKATALSVWPSVSTWCVLAAVLVLALRRERAPVQARTILSSN
jgi:hypothetical protein